MIAIDAKPRPQRDASSLAHGPAARLAQRLPTQATRLDSNPRDSGGAWAVAPPCIPWESLLLLSSFLPHGRALHCLHGHRSAEVEGSADVLPQVDDKLVSACSNLVACELRTEAYRSSPAPKHPGHPGRGGPLTIYDQLVNLLVMEFASRYALEDLSDDDLLAAAKLDREEREQGTELYQDIVNRAKDCSLYQLWDDLTTHDSSRHDAAMGELRFHAREHLERSRFIQSGAPAFESMRRRYEKLWAPSWQPTTEIDPEMVGDLRTRAADDIFQSFYTEKVLPILAATSPLQSSPLHFHRYLQRLANRFMSDEWKLIKEKHLADLSKAISKTDDNDAPDPIDLVPVTDQSPTLDRSEREETLQRILGLADDHVRSLSREDRIEKGTFLRKVVRELLTELPDTTMARILDCVANRSQGRGFDLLVFLLTAVPEVSSEASGGGKNDEARRSLGAWISDTGGLERYLRALDIGEDQVQAVFTLAREGLRTAPSLSDSAFSRRKTAFRDELWECLIASTRTLP